MDRSNNSCQSGTSSATNLNLKPKNHGKDIMDDRVLDDQVDANVSQMGNSDIANGSLMGDSDDASNDEFEYYLEEESDNEFNFSEEKKNNVSSTQLHYVEPISPEVEESVPGCKNSMLNNKKYHYEQFKHFNIIKDDLCDHFFIKEGLSDAQSVTTLKL